MTIPPSFVVQSRITGRIKVNAVRVRFSDTGKMALAPSAGDHVTP
jgi:hypothetical protein